MTTNQLEPDGWVDKYADYLYNYTVVRVSDHETAKDLVQETFFAGLQAAKNFKGNAAERTWLIAILKRKIIDYYRKINSQKGKAEIRMDFAASGEREEDWLEAMVADTVGAHGDKQLENIELGLAIQNCIGQLPEKQARAFTLKTIGGMSTEDVCNEMGINPSNLWVIIHRARGFLMNCLNESWFK